MTKDIICVVIDTGSGMTKAGFAGSQGPCQVFPTVVGKATFKKADE